MDKLVHWVFLFASPAPWISWLKVRFFRCPPPPHMEKLVKLCCFSLLVAPPQINLLKVFFSSSLPLPCAPPMHDSGLFFSAFFSASLRCPAAPRCLPFAGGERGYELDRAGQVPGLRRAQPNLHRRRRARSLRSADGAEVRMGRRSGGSRGSQRAGVPRDVELWLFLFNWS